MNTVRTSFFPSGAPQLLGPYKLLRRLAHGGMAEVFLARPLEAPDDSRPIVIKCMLPDLPSDPQFLAMFVNEAQLAAQMHHPGIVSVLDFGEASGRLFMAMEYVEGLDCWRFSRRLSPWGEDHAAMAAFIVMNVLEALEHVHNLTDVNGLPLGVVHRDLSPSNIYLSVEGDVKLGDFGIARIDSSRYRKVTVIPKGKYGYVAPEQVGGASVDARADIFSMGVVLAELLIGKRMFAQPNQLSTLVDIRDGRLPTLDRNQHLVEAGMLSILHRSLARFPNERFESATAFREALRSYTQRSMRLVTKDDLAALVRRALTIADSKTSMAAGHSGDLTPLSQEATGREVAGSHGPIIRRLTPVTAVGRSNLPFNAIQETPALADDFETPLAEDGTPITAQDSEDAAMWTYVVQLRDGGKLGPTSYANLIELIFAEKVGPDTLVSVRQGPFLPLSAFPELVRHVPPLTPHARVGEFLDPLAKGDFADEPPSAVALGLSERRFSGLLVVRRGSMRKEVYWSDGKPVYVSSNDPAEMLGEYLLARGAIGRVELNTALALLPKFNGHLGDTLIALGLVPAVELLRHIGAQISERFAEVVRWRQGLFELYDNVACRPDVVQVELDPFSSISSILLEQTSGQPMGHGRWAACATAMIRLGATAKERLDRLSLPRELAIIVRRLREPMRLSEMFAIQSDLFGEENVERALFIAFEAGIWRLEDTTLPWRERNTFSRE
ncbi:MAG: serine/threonine protein kinase [Myxococcota bacterium]|jgi:serine/threonine-protein kinase|nr:serine/threonine protein kinase [Myxococcota bacterium]